MAKTKSNNRRTKTSTRRRRGGLFGYDVRANMAKAMGKSEDAFKPADMGIMDKANEMGAKATEMGRQGIAAAKEMGQQGMDKINAMRQGNSEAAPARGGRRRRRSRKNKKSKKAKKSKKHHKKSRRGRRRH